MKIAVIGSGAMGCLYGAYLSKDNEVIMIDGWKDNVEKINENGITLDEENGSYTYKAKAYEDSRDINDVDLVIVFVKSINTISELNKHKNILPKWERGSQGKKGREKANLCFAPFCIVQFEQLVDLKFSESCAIL